jgi:hypothetical protein
VVAKWSRFFRLWPRDWHILQRSLKDAAGALGSGYLTLAKTTRDVARERVLISSISTLHRLNRADLICPPEFLWFSDCERVEMSLRA